MNIRLLKRSLKRGLLYNGLTLAASIFLVFYNNTMPHSSNGALTAAVFFQKLADTVFLIGMTYSYFFMMVTFGTGFSAEVAYGGTRKNALQHLIISIASSSVLSLLFFCIFRSIGAGLGASEGISLKLIILCLNILLLILSVGLLSGYATAKHGKSAFYTVFFVVLGIGIGAIISTALYLSKKNAITWTQLSDTFLAAPAVSAALLAMLTVTTILVNRGIEKMEVKL